jgi:hypothetical protein
MSRKPLAALGILVLAAVVVVGAVNLLDHRRTVKEIRALRDHVYRARVSADSCRNELAYQERTFRRFDVVVDSLRGEVRAFERLDERGVPEDRYDEYLERFDGYNDSVAAWRLKADSLRAAEATCRALIEGHNVLADSLRARLETEETG